MAELKPSPAKRVWVAGSLLAVLVLTAIIPWQLTGTGAEGISLSASKSGVVEGQLESPTVLLIKDSTAKVNALKHARLKLRVVELASGDHYLLKMDPDISRKWHPLLRKTRDEVNAILDSIDLTSEQRGLHTITQQLVSGRLIADSQAYEVVNIVTDGDKFRETWERGGSVVYDGNAGVIFDPANRQARISRFVQAMTLRGLDTGPHMLQTLDALEKLPKRGRYALNSDGTVRRWVSYALPNDAWVEQTRYGYKQYSNAVTFPTVQISASYDASNALYRLLIIVIEDAEFDPDLPADAFRVAVPANTAVWNERGTPHLRAVTEPVEDLVKFVDDSAP